MEEKEKKQRSCEFCSVPSVNWGNKLIDPFSKISTISILFFVFFDFIWLITDDWTMLYSAITMISASAGLAILMLFPRYVHIFRDKLGQIHYHLDCPRDIDRKYFRPRANGESVETADLEIPGLVIKLKIFGLLGQIRLLGNRTFPDWIILGAKQGYVRLSSDMIEAVNDRTCLSVKEISVSPEMALDLIEKYFNINETGTAIISAEKTKASLSRAQNELNVSCGISVFLKDRLQELIEKLDESKTLQNSDIGRYAREELERMLKALPDNDTLALSLCHDGRTPRGVADILNRAAGPLRPIPVRHKAKKATAAEA